MGNKGDLDNFECSMVVGATQDGQSILETFDVLGST